jgi:hypothetical protein
MSYSLKQTAVERLVPELQAQGFQVFANPTKKLSPLFLGDYVPDIIGIGDGKNVAIALAGGDIRETPPLKAVSKLFAGQDDWEFRIFESMDQCRALVEGGSHAAAFLLSWATLEAIGRHLMHTDLAKPQTPGRMIELMAHNGIATPDEADRLRHLSKLRNRLIHGELDAKIGNSESGEMLHLLESIVAGAEMKRSRRKAA